MFALSRLIFVMLLPFFFFFFFFFVDPSFFFFIRSYFFLFPMFIVLHERFNFFHVFCVKDGLSWDSMFFLLLSTLLPEQIVIFIQPFFSIGFHFFPGVEGYFVFFLILFKCRGDSSWREHFNALV